MVVGLVGRTAALEAIMIRYPALPLTAVQEKLGDRATPVAPLAGAESVGAIRFPAPDVPHAITRLYASTDPRPVA